MSDPITRAEVDQFVRGAKQLAALLGDFLTALETRFAQPERMTDQDFERLRWRTARGEIGVAELDAEACRSRAENLRLRQLLARLEWSGRDTGGYSGVCPACDGVDPAQAANATPEQVGHRPGCDLAREIGQQLANTPPDGSSKRP